MSTDLRELLDGCAPRPRAKVNVQSVIARGNFLRWRRRLLSGSLVIVLALGGWGIAQRTTLPSRRPSPVGSTLQTPQPRAGTGVFDIAFGEGAVWALTCRGCSGNRHQSVGRALRIDPVSGRVLASVRLINPSNIAVGDGSIWVSSFWDDTVTRIDSATSRVVATIKVRLPFAVCSACQGAHDFLPFDIAFGEGAVWVSSGRGALAQVDPASNKVVATIRLPGDTTGEVAAGEGSVWVTENVLGLYRIDAATGRIDRKITVDRGATGRLAVDHVIVGRGAVYVQGAWARGSTDSTGHGQYALATGAAIARIDPITDRSVVISANGDLMAFDGRRLWLRRRKGTKLAGVDPRTGRMTSTLEAPPGGRFIAVGAGAGWIARSDGSLSKEDLPVR